MTMTTSQCLMDPYFDPNFDESDPSSDTLDDLPMILDNMPVPDINDVWDGYILECIRNESSLENLAMLCSMEPVPSAYQPGPSAYQPGPSAYQPEPSAYQPEPSAYQPEPSAYQLGSAEYLYEGSDITLADLNLEYLPHESSMLQMNSTNPCLPTMPSDTDIDLAGSSTTALNQLMASDQIMAMATNDNAGNMERFCNAFSSDWEPEVSVEEKSPLLANFSDFEGPPLMVNPITGEPSDEEEICFEPKPYFFTEDHNYCNPNPPKSPEPQQPPPLRLDQLVPVKIEIKDECSSDVDVWNDPGFPSPPIAASDPPSPVPCTTRTRRCKAKAPQQVSINKAAKTALKRPRTSNKMTTRKRRKVGNSLETSPSGTDSDDPRSPMPPPPKKAPAKRGAAKKGTSAKPTKSEVQRETHNQNEKMRRTQMTEMMDRVREIIPTRFFEHKTNSKTKASKQKVLIAAKAYCDFLNKVMQDAGQYNTKEEQQEYYDLKRELTALKSKLDKVVKRFMDKFHKVRGYPYVVRRR